MGFRVLLIAVTDKDPETVHVEYGVTPTGEFEEIAESPVTGAALPSGAYLLYINDEIVPDDRVLARLSKNASLLSCYANETVMNSFASSWVNGVNRWSVFHDAQQGITHLETTGKLPDQFKPIRDLLFAEQGETKDSDYIFYIPIDLFVALGGLRYDQDIEGADPEPWHILKRT
ncbi:MAG: hypothetical protein R3C17_09540 [Planctomycetaceae bacterium]